MRHLAGKSISPWSACSSLRSMANRLDLPAPLAPIRPILSPGFRVRSTDSSSGLVPRMRLTLMKRIIGTFLDLTVLLGIRWARRAHPTLLFELVGSQQENHIVAGAGGE